MKTIYPWTTLQSRQHARRFRTCTSGKAHEIRDDMVVTSAKLQLITPSSTGKVMTRAFWEAPAADVLVREVTCGANP